MDPAKNNTFPFILALLNEKPFLWEREKSLLKELRKIFKQENMNIKNLKKDFDEALEIGKDLGILRVIDDKTQPPFSLNNKKEEHLSRSKSLPAATRKNKKSTKKNALSDKERRSRRRRSSSNRTRESRTRSRSKSSRRAAGRRRSSRRGSQK